MTDQEIIKALECCANELGCEKCPANEDCDNGMLVKNLFALVTRQQAEIEKLQEIHADATESLRLAAEANKDMQAKIEGLEAEAVREFAERLRKEICGRTTLSMEQDRNVLRYIDNLVKEMAGDP